MVKDQRVLDNKVKGVMGGNVIYPRKMDLGKKKEKVVSA